MESSSDSSDKKWEDLKGCVKAAVTGKVPEEV